MVKARSSLNRAARIKVFAATFPPTPILESVLGASIPFPAILRSPSNIGSLRWRPKHGPANSTNGEEAALRGTPWHTIRGRSARCGYGQRQSLESEYSQPLGWRQSVPRLHHRGRPLIWSMGLVKTAGRLKLPAHAIPQMPLRFGPERAKRTIGIRWLIAPSPV